MTQQHSKVILQVDSTSLPLTGVEAPVWPASREKDCPSLPFAPAANQSALSVVKQSFHVDLEQNIM